jgi:large subunit ribosomal protein L15
LHRRGLIKKAKRDVVVLGTGEISKALRVSAHRFTKSAREKIEQAGGAANLITRESSPSIEPPQS